jgi:transcriptional regulator with XRE-family HTH domain
MDRVETNPRVRRGLEIIGRAVWEARRRAGLSQRQLGYRAGVHQSTISRLERGRLTGMRLQRLATIVAVLDQLSIIDIP